MPQFADARISPVFRYRDAPRAIEWLTGAYGFVTQELHSEPTGDVAHAELRFGPSAIGISSAGPVVAGNPWTAVRLGVYVCLKEVDAFFARAVSARAEVARPLADTSYGARDGSLRDPGGHLWSVGTYPMGAPDADPTLFVALHYTDGRAAASFLQQAFGLEPGLVVDTSGAIDHGEFTLGRDVTMMSASPRERGYWGDDSQCTCAYVADVDAHHARAVAAGATILQPPQDTPYGARGYYTSDSEGFVWGFSTYRPTPAGLQHPA